MVPVEAIGKDKFDLSRLHGLDGRCRAFLCGRISESSSREGGVMTFFVRNETVSTESMRPSFSSLSFDVRKLDDASGYCVGGTHSCH
jgi:hypothetical protein